MAYDFCHLTARSLLLHLPVYIFCLAEIYRHDIQGQEQRFPFEKIIMVAIISNNVGTNIFLYITSYARYSTLKRSHFRLIDLNVTWPQTIRKFLSSFKSWIQYRSSHKKLPWPFHMALGIASKVKVIFTTAWPLWSLVTFILKIFLYPPSFRYLL